MTKRTFIRIGALTAIAGGALRAAGSFAPVVIRSDRGRESLYVTIDVALAVGLLAFFSQRGKRLGPWGVAGLAFALVGITTVRANQLITTADLYPLGALMIACGVVMLSFSAWRVTQLRGWVPVTFVCSTLTGILGTVIPGANTLFVWSGVMFGIAFAGLGEDMWRSSSVS